MAEEITGRLGKGISLLRVGRFGELQKRETFFPEYEARPSEEEYSYQVRDPNVAAWFEGAIISEMGVRILPGRQRESPRVFYKGEDRKYVEATSIAGEVHPYQAA